MSDIITAKDLSLWYGNHQALTDISVGIPEKSITALIGPSGCGKSTFLKTLNRMNDLIPGVRITGDVRYRDMDVYAPSTDVTALRRQDIKSGHPGGCASASLNFAPSLFFPPLAAAIRYN